MVDRKYLNPGFGGNAEVMLSSHCIVSIYYSLTKNTVCSSLDMLEQRPTCKEALFNQTFCFYTANTIKRLTSTIIK